MAKDLSVKKGQCINFGNCSKANAREMIKVNLGDDFICPECEGSLMEPPPKKRFPPVLKWVLIIVGIIAVLGVGVFFGFPLVKELLKKEVQVVSVEDISLDIGSFSFENEGESRRLIATVYPQNAAENDKKVTWKSSDSEVATVDSDGLVTAVASGSTLISACTDNGISAICFVTVGKEENVNIVTAVSLNKTTLSLKTGGSEQLIETVYPQDATNKEVNWSSDNPTVAKVNSTGLVTAETKGTAKISVTADGGKTAICTVTVVDNGGGGGGSGTVPVTGGSYTGELKNGQPHGMGTIRYNSHTLIDSRDPKNRYAEAGHYITGEFYNGRLVQGKWFDKNNNQLETIILGRAN